MKTDERSIVRRIKYAASRNRSISIKDIYLELNQHGGESINDAAARFAEKSGTDWIYDPQELEFHFYV